MKKFIVFIVFMLIGSAFAVQAQNSATYDKQLNESQSLFEYRGKAVDTLGIGKTTFSYTFFKPSVHSQEVYFEIGLDSISGTAASTKIDFQSRKNIFAAWTSDSTDYWAGTTSDTTIVYYNATASPEPYRRILVTYTSAFKIKIDWLSILMLED